MEPQLLEKTVRGFAQKVAFKSAKPTTDTSPALQCWEERAKKNLPVRETDG
jgi:hypothetical protein